MNTPAKATAVLVALLMLGSVLPLLAAGGTGDGGVSENRQDGGPLDEEDAMVEYAILTSFSFVSEFERLAKWKTEKGLYAKVYPTDWVTNNYQGRDSREQYHAFLRDLFNHTGGNLKYLLIGGDNEIVRTREIWTGDKGWAYSGPTAFSDHYYAGLDHDWDENRNGKYGEVLNLVSEPDWDAEIAVGRAPVSNVQEAGDVVDKLLRYERSPEVGDWMRTAVMASSVMNPPNTNETIYDDPSHIYKWWEDNAWESILRTMPYIPTHMDRNIIYDYNQIMPGNYTPANDTLNRTTYIEALNEGSSIFVSVTHGWIPTGNGIPHYAGDGVGFNWTSAFYYTDIPNLQNGNKTPFVYFSSCYVGNFTEMNDTNFEKLFTMRDGGVIGFIAPTENTYRGEEYPGISDGNWWMSETFWKYLLVNGSRPGDALYDMIRDYGPHIKAGGGSPDHPFFQQNHAAYNLIGDPETPIWLDIPKTMTVTLDEIYDLEYEVPVRVMEGAIPVEGARVCLKGEDFYAYAITDADGWALVPIQPGDEGQSVTVTATADGFIPYQTVTGVTPAPVELEVVLQTIRAATDIPEAGAPTTVSAEVRNIGHADALSFAVEFYDGDPLADGTPLGSAVDVPGLPAGMSAIVKANWAAPTAGWHDVLVVVDANEEIDEVLEDNNLGSALVYVSAINAEATAIEMVGSEVSTSLPFGVEAEISVTVTSAGSAELPPARVRLYLGDPAAGGLPVGNDRTTPTIAAGGTGQVTFRYTPAQVGTFRLFARVDPDHDLREFDDTDNEVDMSIKVGHPPVWSPIPDVQMVEDNSKTIELTRYLTDYDTPISGIYATVFSVTTNRATLTIEELVLIILPDTNWHGGFSVELQASDGDFASMVGFDVVVEARNDAPVFNNTPPVGPIMLEEGERWYYVIDAFDPDGDAVFLSDNSELFDITPDGVIDYTPTFGAIEYSPIHVFRIIATDGKAQQYFPMTLEMEMVNTAPELYLPERFFGVETESFSYQVKAVDREGDPLTYSEDSDLFDIIPSTGQIMFTPVNKNVGKHNFTITVSDGEFEVNDTVEFYIYEAPYDPGDFEDIGWWVLAGQAALVVIGTIYLVTLIRAKRREEAERTEADGR